DDSADIGPLILDTYTTCVKPSPGATLLVPVGTHQMKSQISFNKPVPFTFRIDGKINIPYDPKLAGNMISFFLAKNIVVTGSGSIHGNGGQYRPNNDLTKHPNRPRLLRLERTHNSVVSGLHFVNAAKFHVVVMGDYNVVENIRITADYIGETDGINMSGTGNRVRNIYVKGGDECVTVKSPTTDFVAENIFCEGTAGTNIGSFGRGGTAAIDGVSYKNVTLVGGSKAGIMIKSYPSANGYIRNLKYENYKMTDAAYPISIDMNWCVPGPCESAIGDLKVENAQFSNFEVGGMPSSDADRVKSKRPLIKVACHPGKSCTDI
ncbi:pectin lyase-like protein, partial [Powellomyces hirtus]